MVARALVTAAAGRQESAKALAESEARFRALFQRSPSGMILLDPDTMRVIDSNAVAASDVGCPVAEFHGRTITDFSLQTRPERFARFAGRSSPAKASATKPGSKAGSARSIC